MRILDCDACRLRRTRCPATILAGNIGNDRIRICEDTTVDDKADLRQVFFTGFTSDFDILGSIANGNPSWYHTFAKQVYENAGFPQPRTPNKASAGYDAKNGRGNAYENPLRDSSMDRIYRVYPKGSSADIKPELDPAKPDPLLAGLAHPNLFWRLQAQSITRSVSLSPLRHHSGSKRRGAGKAEFAPPLELLLGF